MGGCCKDKKAFLRYKHGHSFDLMDFDKNGKFEKKDFIGWYKKSMENVAVLAGNEVTDDQVKKVERQAGIIYNAFMFFGFFGKNKKRFVGFSGFVSQMPGYKMITKLLFKKLFKLFDVDDSGDWSLEEYVKIFCEPIGISEEDAKESFKMLDTDGNGVLDVNEVTDGMTHFLTDLEKNKWSYMFGPVDYDPDEWKE
mmetsp:Transcript_20732/g.31504  ORF Transcript_20732/g.31504 Transcript_20732/m.31504 type:complete len:196 (-) Transcript_20732:130-717(-)